jgi:hypothetical protein
VGAARARRAGYLWYRFVARTGTKGGGSGFFFRGCFILILKVWFRFRFRRGLGVSIRTVSSQDNRVDAMT